MIRMSLPLLFGALALGTAPLAAQEAGTESGEDLYMIHCAACHGEDAASGATGNIRGLSRGTIVGAMGGVEQMPSFSFLTAPEIDAIAAWLGAPDP
jgi:mono/diheme cytochrome c family protein